MYFTTIFKTGENVIHSNVWQNSLQIKKNKIKFKKKEKKKLGKKKEKTTYVQVGTKDIWEIAVLFAQFSYEHKTLQNI